MIATSTPAKTVPARPFSVSPSSAPLAFHESADAVVRADSTDPSDPAEPIENADPTEPTDPIESADPTDPTDSNEPREPTDSKEASSDHSESLRIGGA